MLNPTTAKHTWSAWALALRGAEAHCTTVHPLDVTTTNIVAVMQSLAPTQEEVHRPRNDYTATATEVATQPQGAPKGTADPQKTRRTRSPRQNQHKTTLNKGTPKGIHKWRHRQEQDPQRASTKTTQVSLENQTLTRWTRSQKQSQQGT